LFSALQGEQADGSGDLRLDFGIGATPGVMLDLLTSCFVSAVERRSVDGQERLAIDYRVEASREVDVAAEGYSTVVQSGADLSQAVLIFAGDVSRFGQRLSTRLGADTGAGRSTADGLIRGLLPTLTVV